MLLCCLSHVLQTLPDVSSIHQYSFGQVPLCCHSCILQTVPNVGVCKVQGVQGTNACASCRGGTYACGLRKHWCPVQSLGRFAKSVFTVHVSNTIHRISWKTTSATQLAPVLLFVVRTGKFTRNACCQDCQAFEVQFNSYRLFMKRLRCCVDCQTW